MSAAAHRKKIPVLDNELATCPRFFLLKNAAPPQHLNTSQYDVKTGVILMASLQLGMGEENQERFSPSSSRLSLILL